MPSRDSEEHKMLQLPNTFTGYQLTLAIGLALLLSGIAGAVWWRRERFAYRTGSNGTSGHGLQLAAH